METLTVDQQNYKDYVADRVRFGGWSEGDVAEYRVAVADVMKNGTADEKQSARDFWRIKAAPGPEAGINERIRASLAEEKRKAA